MTDRDKGPRADHPSVPVVIEVQRPRTQDLAAGSRLELGKLGALAPVLVSVLAGAGGIVKAYHQVEANRVKLAHLERRLTATQVDLDWLCAEAVPAKLCLDRKAKAKGEPSDDAE